jgi:hypothetical protein
MTITQVRIPEILSGTLLLLLASCGGLGDRSRLSQFPADLTDPKREVSGIDQDGWMEDTSSATLAQPSGDRQLTIRGMVPNLGNANFQTTVQLRVDNLEIGTKTVGPGEFQLSEPVQSAPGNRRITVTFSQTQQLPGGDGRTVGARLQFLGFEPSSRKASGGDIVRSAGIQLGGGWGVLESFRGETFRWVDNDARIRVTSSQTREVPLKLVVAPGPGVAGKPFLLKALDESGHQIAAVRVDRKASVQIYIPVEGGKPSEILLHVDGGGNMAPNDRRILNFRVFEIGTDR